MAGLFGRGSYDECMLRGLVLTAIPIAAACSRAPDMATSKLVGTWYVQSIDVSQIAREMSARGQNPALFHEAMEAWMPERARVVDTFRADGTCSLIDLPTLGGAKESVWRLLDERDDRLTIEIDSLVHPNGRWLRTIVFTSPDKWRDEGGWTFVQPPEEVALDRRSTASSPLDPSKLDIRPFPCCDPEQPVGFFEDYSWLVDDRRQ